MLAFLALLFVFASAGPLHVVVFDHDMSVADLHAHIKDVLGDLSNAKYIYDVILKGYAAELSLTAMRQIQKHPMFKYMEEDQPVHILDSQQSCDNHDSISWGLPRISEKTFSGRSLYHYPSQLGRGVVAYIVDTGLYVAHTDFSGRAVFGYKAQPEWSNTDGNGHGTHVGSTVGGDEYGVAKGVRLVAVKVLSDSGSGSYAGVIAGCNWALDEYKKSGLPGVANLSLGGPKFQALNDALNKAVREGLFVVVAAGNSNANSCNDSPSSAEEVITVGSTDQTPAQPPKDIRSYFSSYGPCVDVWAPGSDITGAWIGNPDATRTISGTSMASPHVAGVACLIYGDNPAHSTREVANILTDGTATHGVIDLNCGTNTICQQSPNSMVFNSCGE
jgi:subtilisin family serine protease